jgi:hypothetical protein
MLRDWEHAACGILAPMSLKGSAIGIMAAASLLAVPGGAAALEPGVHADPDSPAGTEYALPLESARQEGGGGGDQGAGGSSRRGGDSGGASRGSDSGSGSQGAGSQGSGSQGGGGSQDGAAGGAQRAAAPLFGVGIKPRDAAPRSERGDDGAVPGAGVQRVTNAQLADAEDTGPLSGTVTGLLLVGVPAAALLMAVLLRSRHLTLSR